MASGPDANLDELLDLVRLVCAQDQIQRLLRQAKEADGAGSAVRYGGKLDVLVYQHLRDAIQTGKVSRDAVYALVGESEESGNLHIFYFAPKDDRVRQACNDAERVASRLFGPNWRAERGFPKYHFREGGFEWTDFRSTPTADPDRSGWVAKAYAGVMREKHVETRTEPPNRTLRVFEPVLAREIFLIRWHPWGLLELRVPLERTHKAILDSLHGLWSAAQSAISSDDFHPFDLTPACRRMIDRYEENTHDYRLGDVHLLDSAGGTTRVSPRSGEEHLMHVEDRRRAIELFDRCNMLVVVWLLSADAHGTKRELRSVVGKLRPNEVVMVSKTTAKAVDHVTHRLRQFSE
jgi:hypothetical protein